MANRIYAMLAISDASKLNQVELLTLKELLKEHFKNCSPKKILKAFSWGLTQDLDIKRLDFKTFSRVVKAYDKHLQCRQSQLPLKKKPKQQIGYTLSDIERKHLLEGYYRDWEKGRDTTFFAVKTGCFEYLKLRYNIAEEIISRQKALKIAKEKLKMQYRKERKELYKEQKQAKAKELSEIIHNGMFKQKEINAMIKQVVIEAYFESLKQANENNIE